MDTSEVEGEVRSSEITFMDGEERWAYFAGERTARVMEVLGRVEIEDSMARPSSPAPRRRMHFGSVVMVLVG